MYLLETITYSNPVYSNSGVLTGVDLLQGERVVRLELGEPLDSGKVLASNVSEGEVVASVIDTLLSYGVDYKEAIKDRDIMEEGYKWLGEHTSDEDMEDLNANVNKFKPSYDTLVQLLGSTDNADKAIQQHFDKYNSGFSSILPDRTREEHLGHNNW